MATKKAAAQQEKLAAGEAATAEPARADEAAKESKKKERPVRCIHEHADVELRRAFPQICSKFLDEAGAKGSVPHAKVMLDVAKQAKRQTKQQKQEPSLSDLLMAELKRRQDEREAAADRQASGGATSEREEKD